MHKIFKYNYSPSNGKVIMPEVAEIIRIDYVNDGFYKGHFLWAIVDSSHVNIPRKVFIPEDDYNLNGYDKIQLAVKEKQKIESFGTPVFAREDDGKIYIYCETGGEKQTHKIAVFKTGQEIDIPIEKLRYIGLNRLWIIQELGLYTFVIED